MIQKILIGITLMIFGSSCVSKWFSDQDSVQDISNDSNSQKKQGSTVAVAENESNSSDLKMARLWNKIESLEEEIRFNKERIRLLESGMTTGLAQKPNVNFKTSDSTESLDLKKARSSLAKSPNGLRKPEETDDHAKGLDGVHGSPSRTVNSSMDQYKVRVQMAKEYYQASRFGLAVSEFSQIQSEFGKASGDGEAKIYLGKSYLALKEYTYAKTEFDDYLTMFPGSEIEAEVRLDLAKVYLGMNLRERARDELSSIATKYKGTESGSIALREMEKMKGTL